MLLQQTLRGSSSSSVSSSSSSSSSSGKAVAMTKPKQVVAAVDADAGKFDAFLLNSSKR
jgi:hypothetical protein